MTIITKPLSEKKACKLDVPLVENDQLEENLSKSDDVEGLEPVTVHRFVILRSRSRRVTSATTFCLLLTALVVVSSGIIAGTYLYRHYAAQMQVHHLWCRIPYKNKENNMNNMYTSHLKAEQPFLGDFKTDRDINTVEGFWEEKIEINFDDNENYEKIDVPDFNDGRRGRFIHDFNSNVTGIIDIDDRRCFVMPLDRDAVLPPRSLFDLINKIWDGYYTVNTEIVRETMKVVTPAVKDLQTVGTYIARECKFLPIYRLEKVESTDIMKRSADEGVKFAQYSGKSIIEFDILNLNDVIEYEKNSI